MCHILLLIKFCTITSIMKWYIFVLPLHVSSWYFVNVLWQCEDRLTRQSGWYEPWLMPMSDLLTENHMLASELQWGLRFYLLLWFLICLLADKSVLKETAGTRMTSATCYTRQRVFYFFIIQLMNKDLHLALMSGFGNRSAFSIICT